MSSHRSPSHMSLLGLACCLIVACVAWGPVAASEPGLPFTEDFSDTNLRDDDKTNANWSVEEQALVLGKQEKRFGAFWSGGSGVDISSDGHDTWSVALGDVDGDGDLDLLAGNSDQPNRLYFNNGTPDPWNGVSGVDITSDMHATFSIALGDVDGDGDLDLVAGNSNQPNRLYLNNGTPDPWGVVPGVDITSDAHDTRSIALADVDGDGDLDLVAGNNGQNNRLYLNNGTPDPWNGVSGVDITSDMHATFSIVLGDVDNDGDLDLVAGNSDDEVNRLYLNNGTPDPWNGVSGVDIGSSVRDTRSVVLGDLDSDGDLDLVVGNDGVGNLMYLNNGTTDPWNGVSARIITPNNDFDSLFLALGDVDGDGDLDLVAGNPRYESSRLYLNWRNGKKDMWPDVDITSDTGYYTRSIALGDVDGDGDLDLVAGNIYDDTNRLYLNNSTENPWNGVQGIDFSDDDYLTHSLVLGDVENDGDLDLVEGNSGYPNRLYKGFTWEYDFHWGEGTDIGWGANISTVALGDVDNDGDLDLVEGNGGQPNRLYWNNGTTDPWNPEEYTVIGSDADWTTAVALGDVDNDGDLDLVTGALDGDSWPFTGSINRLYLNNGTADPWNGVEGTAITSDAVITWSVVLGDVDGDGDLDLLAGNGTDQLNRLYLNNGTADPWNGVEGMDLTPDENGSSMVLGDVDRDGDLDLVEGRRLYLNNGTPDPWYEVEGTDVISSGIPDALVDADNDGDLDLVVRVPDEPTQLYLNNGTADPWNGVEGMDISSSNGSGASFIVLGDVDSDGDPDLVEGNGHDVNRTYLNNGRGNPWNGVSGVDVDSPLDYVPTSVALGDVDNDGDMDLLAGNSDHPNHLYINNGTPDPWNGVSGVDVTSDMYATFSIALGDVDNDGDLDLLAGNSDQPNRLYLNNGTADPWNGVSGVDVTSDAHDTRSVALADADNDGDLDLVAGNSNQPNRLYLNNGTADPWNGVSGVDITSDMHATFSIVLGDVDNDGDLDLVAGNSNQPNRLYLNNGTADPWNGVSGMDVTSDAHDTRSVALADVNNYEGNGHLDLLVGNSGQPNRLYRNNGTPDPWNGVEGTDITADVHDTRSIVVADVDNNGALDLLVGNSGQPNRLYLNYIVWWGSEYYWEDGVDVSSDVHDTRSIALGDVDGDGSPNLVEGALDSIRMYSPFFYHTGHGYATSLEIDTETSPILNATLFATASLPTNTAVEYWLSNNGGQRWYLVMSGKRFLFPTGGSDLRWKAELSSLSPARTPRIEEILLITEEIDSDGDGLLDGDDNCPNTPNPDQLDTDQDGVGDACDNCPDDYNPGQEDSGDGDGVGDLCDNCPDDYNPNQEDSDGDGYPDACDVCPANYDPGQEDADQDGIGNLCDNCPLDANNDIDGDTFCGDVDNCPFRTNTDQADADADGIGDLCDNCPADPNTDQADADADGIGDLCDNCPDDPNTIQWDYDADGIGDLCDNCPDDPNTDQADADADGIGDLCDNCPDDPNTGQSDSDGDGAGYPCDCAILNPDTYPGALEINDGLDNQCPGDEGYGLIDEISGVCGFHNPDDQQEFSWPAQVEATSYEIARCVSPQFSSGCTIRTTSETYWSDTKPVTQEGTCHYYLVRALTPYIGSWGSNSSGERTEICP